MEVEVLVGLTRRQPQRTPAETGANSPPARSGTATVKQGEQMTNPH